MKRPQAAVLLLALVTLLIPQSAPAETPADFFKAKCVSCHTIGGGRLVGPDLKGVTERQDRAWLARFIVDPQTVLASGDAYAIKLREEARGVVMTTIPGISMDQAKPGQGAPRSDRGGVGAREEPVRRSPDQRPAVHRRRCPSRARSVSRSPPAHQRRAVLRLMPLGQRHRSARGWCAGTGPQRRLRTAQRPQGSDDLDVGTGDIDHGSGLRTSPDGGRGGDLPSDRLLRRPRTIAGREHRGGDPDLCSSRIGGNRRGADGFRRGVERTFPGCAKRAR